MQEQKALVAEHSLVMKADRERVWKAITSAEHFSKWFGLPIKMNRLEPGGEFRFVEIEDSLSARIVTVEPPELYQFEWAPEPGVPVYTLVTIRLEPVEGGTRVTMSEAGFEKLPEQYRKSRFESNSEGWSIQVRNLDNYLKEGQDIGEN
jgi:uncharacterized protein YndB with AHSA1/START domain